MQTSKSEFRILGLTLYWLLITSVFYTLLRIEFLLWNWSTWFHSFTAQTLFKAFIYGVRFDLSSITWLSSLVLIGALIPWPFINLKIKELSLKTVFLLINIPFLFFNIIDIEFIHFSGRRMTPDSFYLISESEGKIGALWGTYWPLILINCGLFFLFYRSINKAKINLNPENLLQRTFKSLKFRIPISIFILIILILMARGGTQEKPLEVTHAMALNSDIRLTNLILNSSFTTIHSLQKSRLSRLNYFESVDEISPLLNGITPGESILPWQNKPKNVVLFILESFGLEYTGLDNPAKKSFTPFLDSIRDRSLYFKNSYANGRRSIEALPSMLAGIPSLLDEPFISSQFQGNHIPQLGLDLKEQGVWTAFFHGGANGTMFFQEFTQRLGFEKYFGRNEYPNSSDYDGTWGIWDGPFLNFFGEQLNQTKSRFFVTFFSLSSHHPFNVPSDYKGKLPEGPLPILQSVAYTDLMLSEFFKKFANSPWYKDTLFIFTADHTSKSYLPEYQDSIGSFKVPILLYYPGSSFSSDIHKLDLDEPVQHIDIFPTLQEIFNLNKSAPQISRSLLKTGPRKVSLYLDGQQLLVEKKAKLILPTEGANPGGADPLLQTWKAHRQYFINSLIDNKF